MDPIILGSLGAALILLAYVLGQFHIWKDTYFIYDFVNAIGSVLLVYYGIVGEAWPFVVLNGVWAIVSVKDIFVDLSRNARKPNSLGPWKKWMQ